eukprot:GHVU01083881.1.p1 GENE.GHVU01083881.1~~GHVU01083881.1.p1  ORF type:complete len:886 (+),score=164.44 GHVU01083881.1:151-2658(+)
MDAVAGVERGNCVEGTIRFKVANLTGYVTWANSNLGDVKIQGWKDLNRAIHGDNVIVEIFNHESWVKKEPMFRGNDSDAMQPQGRVVYIPAFGRAAYVCTLQPNDPPPPRRQPNNNQPPAIAPWDRRAVTQNEEYVKAVPIDQRYPWTLIPMEDVMKYERIPKKLEWKSMYQVKPVEWGITKKLPTGCIVSHLGQSGEPDAEITAAIIAAELEDLRGPCPSEAEDEAKLVSETVRANMDDESLLRDNRVDLRQIRTFTIDPVNARDLDDAISFNWDAAAEAFQLGVHIADVSHYVHPHGAIDTNAQKRTTTLYAPDRCFPMLPRLLCDNLCSLNPNEDKLTFTVFFWLTKDGQLKRENAPVFIKSVIKSCCRLNYEEVQEAIEERHPNPLPAVAAPHTWALLYQDLRTLHQLTAKIRVNRFESGGLKLNKAKISFRWSDDAGGTGTPVSFSLQDRGPSHYLVEELMLLANQCVAFRIRHGPLGDSAVLRSHKEPDKGKLGQVISYLMGLHRFNGLPIEGKTAQTLYRSVLAIRNHLGPDVSEAVEVLMKKPFFPATYVLGKPREIRDDDPLSEEENPTTEPSNGEREIRDRHIHHYALDFKEYTHFTSPIRRYADIMVHRQLRLMIEHEITQAEEDPTFYYTDAELWDMCDKSNDIRRKSKQFQEEVEQRFFCMFLRQLGSPFPTMATVLKIEADAFTCYAGSCGAEKRLYFAADHPHMVDARVKLPNNLTSAFRFPDSVTRSEVTNYSRAAPDSDAKDSIDVVWRQLADDRGATRNYDYRVTVMDTIAVMLVPLDCVPMEFVFTWVPPSEALIIERAKQSRGHIPFDPADVLPV